MFFSDFSFNPATSFSYSSDHSHRVEIYHRTYLALYSSLWATMSPLLPSLSIPNFCISPLSPYTLA